MPRVSDLLNTHPLVGALPAAVRDPLLSNTKETVKGHGTILYREGSRPTGIWLVSIGVVKVSLCLRTTLLHFGWSIYFTILVGSIMSIYLPLSPFFSTVDKSEIK